MNKKTVLLTIQAVLCALTAAVLIGSDLSIYLTGLRARADNPMANIYTVEAITSKAVFVLPVFLAAIAVTIINAVLGIRDDSQDKIVTGIDIGKNVADERTKESVSRVRLVVLVLAIVFIVIGIFNGSMGDVLIKASKICTECIGLG